MTTARGVVDRRKIPGLARLSDAISRIASIRHGHMPTGLLFLLPVTLFIDLAASPIDLFGGPVSMALAFVLESAFLLAFTGKPGRAFLYAGLDLIPFVDVIPFATLTLAKAFLKALRDPPPSSEPPPIDVPYRVRA